jgi:hypothetical protein
MGETVVGRVREAYVLTYLDFHWAYEVGLRNGEVMIWIRRVLIASP